MANFADAMRIRTDALAARAARLESQSAKALGLIENLANRNILIFRDELLARTPYGYLLAPTDDLGLATFLAEGVTWEPETSNLLDLTLREGMTFVDVGANIGLHTLLGARAVGPSGVVFAFEPTPKVFQLLQRSEYLNGLGDICRCTNLALSTSEGVATLHVSDVCGHNSLYQLADEEEKSQLPVKTASFDAMFQEAPQIDVVKLDVEGAELDVLDGMKHLLAKHWNILLIVEYGVPHLERLGIGPAEWFGRFFAHGFALFAFNEQAGAWRQVAEEQTTELVSTNVVFVRPETSLWRVLKQHEA
jgi:FkbM family methyltransferase